MKGAILALYRLRGHAYFLAAAVLIVGAVSSFIPLNDDVVVIRQVLERSALAVLTCSVLLIALGWRALPEHPTRTVAPVVRGRWAGLNSPATKVPSHGIRMYGQAYAIDLTYEPEDTPRPVFGEGPAFRPATDYPSFGQPVFAMISGTVVRASDGQRDHRARSGVLALIYMLLEGAVRECGGPRYIFGNHVIIEGEDGACAAIAHLRRGSLGVRVGDVVKAGQQIAECGNSGNSSEPHVHVQLMDRASLRLAQGMPMAFADVRIDGDEDAADALPGNGQRMVAVRDSRP